MSRSTSRELLLFPFGGNAREALSAVRAINRQENTWCIAGFIDDNPALRGRDFDGVQVLGGREVLDDFTSATVLAVPGNPDTYSTRAGVIASLNLPEDRFARIIDPRAEVAEDATIGTNTLIMANVFVSCTVRIGAHCVILPNTVVSHESRIGDYSMIGSNVSISGGVRVGENCYIGSGGRIRDKLTIGAGALVGLGACVIKDVPEGWVVAGNPARQLRTVLDP